MKAFVECAIFAVLCTLLTVGIFAFYAARVGHPIF